jgi:hypothetical protein
MLFAVCDTLSVEIEGTSQDLRELSQTIRDCSDRCQISLSTPAANDERGLRYLKRLTFAIGSGPLTISVSDQQLCVSGAKDKLDLLSQNVTWLAETQSVETTPKIRDHIHVEFYPGHFFLSEDALPLVLIRQD